MSTEHDEDDSGTALTLAAIAGGAVLLWLLSRGSGNGGGGGHTDVGGDRESASSSASPAIVVRTRAGDAIEVDGISTDLTTMLARARAVGRVVFRTSGDARAGWVSKVFHVLVDAGVDVWRGPEVADHMPRWEERERPVDNRTPAHQATTVNTSAPLTSSPDRKFDTW